MRADYIESLPPAGIVDAEEQQFRRYGGFNPAFVRQVWAKRRMESRQKPEPVERTPGKSGPKPKWTAEQITAIGELLMAGETSGLIARVMGKTRGQIIGIVRRTPELTAIGFQSAYAKSLRGGSST